jgi:arylsulfatase A-like enzyme
VRRGSLAALVVTAIAFGAAVGSASAQARPPNVLIIVTDDQRATNTMAVMPATRGYFVRHGIRFPRGFAVTPLCCPSRATILTGRYAHNTGVRNNGLARALDISTMFPRLLQNAGYRTAMVGKFLNSWPLSRAPPYFHRFALGGGPYTDPNFNVDGVLRTPDGYATDLVGSYAVRFLRNFERLDASPWFLYVAPIAPHSPWIPAPRDRGARVPAWHGNPAVFEQDRSDKPPYVRSVYYTFEQGQSVRRGQLRALMSVDDMVGRIFRTMRERGEGRDTLAFFLSDNGFMWSDHHFGRHSLPGQKRAPYTASVQVPLFLRWPRHVVAGSRDPRLTGTVDIAPTVLAAAGIPPDPSKPPLDGRSMLQPDMRHRIVLEYWREGMRFVPTWASIRTRRFQYVEYYADDGSTRTFREYYDLVRDPWQLRNLLHDGNPANNPPVRDLARQLAKDRVCLGTTGPAACP